MQLLRKVRMTPGYHHHLVLVPPPQCPQCPQCSTASLPGYSVHSETSSLSFVPTVLRDTLLTQLHGQCSLLPGAWSQPGILSVVRVGMMNVPHHYWVITIASKLFIQKMQHCASIVSMMVMDFWCDIEIFILFE